MQSVVPPAAFVAQHVAAPFTAGPQALQAVTVRWPSVGQLAVVAWGLGMLLIAVTWYMRWRRLRRLVSEATPLAFGAAVPVRVTTAALEPGLVGILRPVLLVPERLVDHLTRQELDSIVTHELAHFRRRDNLTFSVHMLSELLFWFYPPIWWLGHRLLLERERACDEAVLTAGHDAQVYGESILKVCRFHVPVSHGWSAGAAGSDLRTRMAAILGKTPMARVTAAKRALLVTALAAALVVPLLVGIVSAPAAAQGASSDMAMTPQQIQQNRYEQARPRTAIPFKPADFDKFVGYYFLPGSYTVIHISRQDDHFLLQPNLAPAAVDIYPDSPTEFFLKVAPAQVSFNLTQGGQVTGLVMHAGGILQPLNRVSARTAQEVQAELQERIKQDKPSPGTEAAARKLIEAQEAGHMDYQKMAPNLAALARLQQPLMQRLFQTLGPLKSLEFRRVAPSGLDVYDATFAQGDMQVVIGPLTSEGKVTAFAIDRPPT
jgi:beta-lactamase regulating signal transducer with metallopeptidase domain